MLETISCHLKPEKIFRPIGVLITFTEVRHSKVKYKFVCDKVSRRRHCLNSLKTPTQRGTDSYNRVNFREERTGRVVQSPIQLLNPGLAPENFDLIFVVFQQGVLFIFFALPF